jgi:hypothetical protein
MNNVHFFQINFILESCYCVWIDWKKSERKRKNLIRLGIDPDQAYSRSPARMGGWAVAQSPIMPVTIKLKRLAKQGYESMLDIETAVYETRLVYPERSRRVCGVRGAPPHLQAVRPSTRLSVNVIVFKVSD